jgi:cephalosporin hydroxylase
MKKDYWADEYRPSQNRDELPKMIAAVAPSEPKVILEIGVYRCGLLRVFQGEFEPDILIGVDNTEQPFAWTKGVEDAVLIAPADSHDPKTLRRVKKALKGREVDLLYIDADHAYAAVKQDFEIYRELVRDGGWIGFHDIAFGPDLGKGLCPEFWRAEVRDRYDTREFISDTGIGLVHWRK